LKDEWEYFSEYDIRLKITKETYEPAEDTFLMLEHVKIPEKNNIVIEIGGGTGIISLALAKKNPKTRFLITDISLKAAKVIVKNVRLNRLSSQIDIICTDTIHALTHLSPDIILWNPPYLPIDNPGKNIPKDQQLMFFGGIRGYEVVYDFLSYIQEQKLHTTIYTIFSSLAWKEEMLSSLVEIGFRSEIIAEEKMFFEKLFLVKLQWDSDD